MNAEFWIKVAARKSRYNDRWESKGTPHASQRKPACAGDEIAIKVTLDIPDALFEEPQLNVTIKVPEQREPPRVSTEMQSGIAAVISQNLGLKVRVSAEPDFEGVT